MSVSLPAAVFFDLDGTLADTADDLAAPVNLMRVERGLTPLPLSEYRPFASAGARGLLGIGLGVTPDDQHFPKLRDEFLNLYEQNIVVHTRLFEGMPEVLDWLESRNIAWGIVSNKMEYLVQQVVSGLGITERAVLAYGGDSAPRPKPYPDLLKRALKETGLNASQCWYVGDDARDIQAGKAAGMITIAAAYGYCSPEAAANWNAHHLIRSPAELLAMLKQCW